MLEIRVLNFVNIIAVAVYFVVVVVTIFISQITIEIILGLKKKVAIRWRWPSLFY